MRPTHSQGMQAAITRRLPGALLRTLPGRVLVGVTLGMAVYLLIQLGRVAAEAMGLCTGCGVDGLDPLGPVALGGGGGALGGGGYDDGGEEDGDKGPFDDWLDKLLGDGRPPKSVEAVEPPPQDPAAREREIQEAERAKELHKYLNGTKGMPEGSVGGELNDAIDRVFDFSRGATEVGPSPDSGDGKR